LLSSTIAVSNEIARLGHVLFAVALVHHGKSLVWCNNRVGIAALVGRSEAVRIAHIRKAAWVVVVS